MVANASRVGDWPLRRAHYSAMMEMMDRQVGRLLEVLERRGLLDSPLVVFTSELCARMKPLEDDFIDPLQDASLSYEDAYVWREDSLYQMIFNDMTGRITGEDHAGAHAVFGRWHHLAAGRPAESLLVHGAMVRWHDHAPRQL